MGLVLRQSTINNGTNTITIKGSALTYSEGDSNFVHLLTNMSGSTISITGSNVGILSTNTTINGTVKFPSLTNSNNNNLVTYNSSTGQLYYFNTASINVGTASYINPLIQNVIITGSLNVTNGITGSLLGTAATASYVQTAQTASYILNAISSSFASTASYVQIAQTASYVVNAQTASYVQTAQTASSVSALNQTVQITGSLLVTGSTTQIGNNTLTGDTVLSGSINISGSSTIQGTTSMTGSLLITGSTIQSGNNTLTGNTSLTGSITISGSTTNTIIGNTQINGQLNVSGSSVFNNSEFTVTGSTYVKGTTNISGSTNITGSFNVVDGDINIVSGSSFRRWGNKLFNHAQFANTSSITLTQNVSGAFNLPYTYSTPEGISIVSGSRITFDNTGLYNIQFSAILTQGAGTSTVHIWFRKTGSNIDYSDTVLTAPGNTSYPIAWNLKYPFSASEYAEILYHSNATNTSFPYAAAGSGFPASPSIIVTVTQIA